MFINLLIPILPLVAELLSLFEEITRKNNNSDLAILAALCRTIIHLEIKYLDGETLWPHIKICQ